eukprot:3682883-Alexandrium_andersonii.AAC.2
MRARRRRPSAQALASATGRQPPPSGDGQVSGTRYLLNQRAWRDDRRQRKLDLHHTTGGGEHPCLCAGAHLAPTTVRNTKTVLNRSQNN